MKDGYLGFAEVLGAQAAVNPELVRCTSAIQRNGTLLLKIIDDILDLSKVEAQRLQIENVEFDLADVLRDVCIALELKADEKGVRMDFNFPPEVKGIYKSDPIRIKQVLLNIIGNAIKFTEQGKVVVETQVSDSKTNGPCKRRITMRVTDSGIGLSSEQAERLFHPFSQAESSTRRHFGGTGLGLVIARHMAAALGGDVTLVSSQLGKGSVFEISFSLDFISTGALMPAPSRPEVKKTKTGWKDKTVLVVDDSEDNRSLIELYLAATGVRILQAGSGFQAIRVVNDHTPDVILMDVQMPMMDGHEATRTIRKLGFDGPIVAFTAHAMRDEAERCRQAGCSSVLTKPVSRQDLFSELGLYL